MPADFIIGLTGTIASGKSVVSDYLSELGYAIIDADVISRQVVEKASEGYEALKGAFPTAFTDGVLDRKGFVKSYLRMKKSGNC